MKWIKKWSFMWILSVSGVIFFTVSDSWAVMLKPLNAVQGWYLEALGRAGLPAMGDSDISDGGMQSVSGQEQSGTAQLSGGDSAGMQQISGGDGGAGSGQVPDGSGEHGQPPEGTGGNGQAPEGAEGNGQVPGETGGNGHVSEGAGGNGQAPGGTEGNGQPPAEGEGTQLPVSRSPEEVVYASVEDDYFADAVFIGDSRTVGMFEYGGLEEITTFYASTGLTIFKLFDAPVVTVPGEKEKQTIEQALSERQFSKIYLMIGINEMGTGTVDTFIQKYAEVVEHLKELQPEAVIYLQGIMKVTTKRSEQGDYINNEGIEARNERIEELADYVKVYYLDVNPLICDETGGMEPSYTFDGVHLKAQYIPIWKDFLKQHAVAF